MQSRVNTENSQKSSKVSTARIAIWYLIGDLLVKGLSVITTPIFSRVLTKQQYGDFSNFTSWESILLIFVTLDLSTSISRAKYDYEKEIDSYISSITAVSTIATAVIYGIIELNAEFFTSFFSMDMFYIRLLFIYFLFEPAYEYIQVKHRMYMKYKFFIFFSLCSAFLRTSISLILVYCMEDKYLGRVLGYMIPAIGLYIGIYIFVWVKGRKIKWEYCKYALLIGLPLVPHTLATNLLSTSDRVMIRKMCGSEQTAIYTLSYMVAAMVTLVRQSLNKAWVPWFFDKLAMEKYDEIRKKSKEYVDLFFLLMIGAMLIAPEMVWILGGEKYYEARFLIPPVIVGLLCQFLYTLYVNIEIFQKKTFSISIGTMLATAINIVLNLLLIPKYGYMAAAYTTLIGYLALVVFHFMMVKFRIKKAHVFDNRYFFIQITIFFFIQFICIELYRVNIIRYIVIGIYVTVAGIIVWKKRDYIRQLLNL